MKPPEPRDPSASNRNESIKQEIEQEAQKLQAILAKLKSQNFYERFGLTKDASAAEIESMRFLLSVFDPSKKSINLKNVCEQISALYAEAFDTLSDPSKRTKYDNKNKLDGKQKIEAVNHVIFSSEYGAPNFIRARNELVRTGTLTELELNALPEVKNNAIIQINSSVDLGQVEFKFVAKSWINAGVLTKEEACALPKVKSKAIAHIKSSMDLGEAEFKFTAKNWIDAGVLTKEEINKIFPTYKI